jgi:hypothetical protein
MTKHRNIRNIALFYACLQVLPRISCGQEGFWPEGKKAAIVLTYDDGITSHLEVAIPQLDRAGYKGTFFIDGVMPEKEILLWREAGRNGHELANHTVYHPCSKNVLKLHPHYVNENYDRQSIIREIAMMNRMLFAIDGKSRRTYAYPCTDTVVGGEDYVDTLRSTGLVTCARIGGGKRPVTDLKSMDFFRIPSWAPVDVNEAAVLIEYAVSVLESGGLGVFQFHGVGGDYLAVSAEAHQGLLEYLESQPDIWVGTFQEVVDYISQSRE